MYDDKSNFEASDLFSRYDIGDGQINTVTFTEADSLIFA